MTDTLYSTASPRTRRRFVPGPPCLACASTNTRLTHRRRVVVCRDCEITYYLPPREVRHD